MGDRVNAVEADDNLDDDVCVVGVVLLVLDDVIGGVLCVVVVDFGVGSLVGVVRIVVEVLDDVDKPDCILVTHLYLT